MMLVREAVSCQVWTASGLLTTVWILEILGMLLDLANSALIPPQSPSCLAEKADLTSFFHEGIT